MKDILTTEEWIRAIKALLFLNKDPENIDIEQIKKIIEENTAGAYELPAVTETDNGKVLGVENGQFGLVNGGSGGADVTIQFTVDESSGSIDEDSVLTDKNYEELKALGKAPLLAKVVLTTDDGDGFYMRYDNWIFLIDAYYGQDFLKGYIFLSGLTGTNVNYAIYNIVLPESGGIRINKSLTFKGGAYVPQGNS